MNHPRTVCSALVFVACSALAWAPGQARAQTAQQAQPTAALPTAHSRQETKLLGAIEAIDRKLVRVETELLSGDAQVRELAAEVSAAESAQAAADGAYKAALHKLGRRLGALTRMGPGLQLAVLTGVRDLSTLVDEQQLMRAIASHDRKLWAAHHASREQLSHTIAVTQERVQALEAAQAQRRAARNELVGTRQRKGRALQSMRKGRERRALGHELQLAQARLGEVVSGAVTADGLPSAPKRIRTGLPWPAKGRVRVAYGQHAETTFGTATFHNGWDIAAAAGSQVKAVASGVVAYAEWLHGYGQVAIIEHPGGYHTVHGHMAQLHVTRGQKVRMGDALGTVGDTGSLRGTVLYFEIRHRGVPQDPRLYLSRTAAAM